MKRLFLAMFLGLTAMSCASDPGMTSRPGVAETSGPLVLTAAGWGAFDQLRQATTFEGAHVGRSGTASQQGLAFCRLLSEKDAARAFRLALRDASPAGRLYALCGLYFTSPDAFHAGVEQLAPSRETVHRIRGCLVSDVSLGEIVKAPPPTAGQVESEPDIASGAIPKELRSLQGHAGPGG